MKIELARSYGNLSVSSRNQAKKNSFSNEPLPETLNSSKAEEKNGYLDTQTVYQKETGISSNPLLDKIIADTEDSFPYSQMADENGVIAYKGAVFVGNSENNTLCLGDMTNEKDVLTIPLSDGGSLRVNRNNINDLAKAIDMFSPADVNRIMKAISMDAKARQKQNEIEDMKLSPYDL